MAEAYRSLRTALIFATSEGAPRLLHFTSASANEGKTTSACSTAITFAQTGSKVLLIDCDLRNPSLHKAFGLPNGEGLTNFLTGASDPASVAIPTQVSRLFVIPSGPIPPNPVELLSGGRMVELVALARERFDFVILDGPPVIGLADAVILANLARATILVVESAGTRVGALEGAAKRLRAAGANILGAILVKHGQAGGYGYDYHYSYSYGASDQRLPAVHGAG
jgi:capsular exopolysaccharide synthesis family protein